MKTGIATLDGIGLKIRLWCLPIGRWGIAIVRLERPKSGEKE
jgi:hypothetical protein